MPKKLVVFSIILILVVVAALALIIKGKPRTPSFNPIDKVEASTWSKIAMEGPLGAVTLERTDKGWQIAEPVKDWADASTVEQMVNTLSNFSVGSIISDNKDRYSQFDVEAGKASHIKVFVTGQDKPILDAYIGKQGPTYSDSYIRFDGDPAVYIASQLPNYSLVQGVDAYRPRRVFPFSPAEASTITITAEKMNISLVRSSDTWTDRSTGKKMAPDWITALSTKLQSWSAYDFGKGDEKPEVLGMETPYMLVKVEGPAGSVTATIGNKVATSDKATPQTRYTKIEGRPCPVMLREETLQETLSHLKKPRI